MVSLPIGEPALLPAALNTYAADPGSLDGQFVGSILSVIGAHAGTLLANLETYGRADRLAEQLREAMASRAAIEQLKG